ncbi:MAG: efflux RND transporter permease subunit [Achromobacter pulmonis]
MRSGRLQTEEEFGDIIVKSSPDGAVTRLSDVARVELGAQEYAPAFAAGQQAGGGHGHLAGAGRQRAGDRPTQVRAAMTELAQDLPPKAWNTASTTTPPSSCVPASTPWCTRCWKRSRWWCWS